MHSLTDRQVSDSEFNQDTSLGQSVSRKKCRPPVLWRAIRVDPGSGSKLSRPATVASALGRIEGALAGRSISFRKIPPLSGPARGLAAYFSFPPPAGSPRRSEVWKPE